MSVPPARPDPYLAAEGLYSDWSPRFEGDVEFYTRLALRTEGSVVELGVGYGRVAIPIAQAGKMVVGVDVSEAALAEGRRRAAEAHVADRLSFALGDMRTYVADPQAGLVTMPFRSFLHMTTTADQLRALECARRSLVPGGRLALNIFVPDPAFIAEHHGRRDFIDEFRDFGGRRCELWHQPFYETTTQRLMLRSIVEAYDGDRLADVGEAVIELRMVYRFEMEHLLARSGFEVEALYGWFDERPFTEDCREMVWVARKPS